MVRQKIVKYIKRAVKKSVSVDVFVPENEKFGHYSTNAALKLAKVLKKNPMEIAKNLTNDLRLTTNDFFEKIEVAAPGFINFWLSPEILQKELGGVLKEENKYGQPKTNGSKQKSINIEFISANPTGSLTIGNGRGGFLGDVLANILEFQGNQVAREYYVNNAKASTQIKELGKTAVGHGTTYLTEKVKSQIAKIKPQLAKLKKQNPENIYGEAGYLLAREAQKDNQKFIKKTLKIKFNKWFSEEGLYRTKAVDNLLKELKKKNLIYQKDNAVWFKSKQFGDSEDRVLVRKTGEPTYFLPDLAYHLNKFKTRKFNKVIDIWGADHHGYEPRLRAGLRAFNIPDEKFKIIITQLIRLIKKGKEVKMSKRKGEYVTLDDLIKEVGLGAARFFFLMNSPDTHMDFNLELAKEKSLKNPVYYVQYAAVRCGSILKKSTSQIVKGKDNLKLLNTSEDLVLIKILAQFPEIIEEAAENYNPQILVRYSLNLARQFHNFYEKERVIEAGNKDLLSARLSLIQATLIVFRNIFKILGVNLPEKM